MPRVGRGPQLGFASFDKRAAAAVVVVVVVAAAAAAAAAAPPARATQRVGTRYSCHFVVLVIVVMAMMEGAAGSSDPLHTAVVEACCNPVAVRACFVTALPFEPL